MAKRCIIWCAVSSEEQAGDDKLSLETQERDMRSYADKEGWEIVKVFRWDGYSRWESDPIAALEDFAEQGRFEYHELRRMWRAREFDVLMLYTHSRAGRSFTMQSWVVENVIRHDGEVFRIHGGWINKRDYAFQIGMGGVLSTNDIDRLIEQRNQAMNVRASKGQPTASRIPFSHMVRRDEYGKLLSSLIVNETYRRLWEDVATLMFEGVGFNAMERVLYERFGHANEQGKKRATGAIYFLFYTPIFWGHSARFFNPGMKRKNGAWVYDDSIPPPEGVLLYRHTHEPIYTGELADRIKAELDRRKHTSGRASSYATNRFTGIFICGQCSYYIGYTRNHGAKYLYCGARRNRLLNNKRNCTEVGGLKESQAQEFFEQLLEYGIEKGEIQLFFDGSDVASPVVNVSRAEQLQTEIDELTEQAAWTLSQANTKKGMRDVFVKQMTEQDERLIILKANLENVLYFETRVTQEQIEEQRVIGELKEMTLATFWSQDDREINQTLHRLLGKRRLAVLNHSILHRFVDKPPNKRV